MPDSKNTPLSTSAGTGHEGRKRKGLSNVCLYITLAMLNKATVKAAITVFTVLFANI